MSRLTAEQFKESVYNYYHNDPFDHVLLDDRDINGRITTVIRYDEDTILIQIIEKGVIDTKKLPNEEFLGDIKH